MENTMLLSVQKMTCNHCVRAVTEAVQAAAPGAQVQVNLAEGTVRIDGAPGAAAVTQAIEAEGYAVRVLEP